MFASSVDAAEGAGRMLLTRVNGKDERTSARVRLSFRGEQEGRGVRERGFDGGRKGKESTMYAWRNYAREGITYVCVCMHVARVSLFMPRVLPRGGGVRGVC